MTKRENRDKDIYREKEKEYKTRLKENNDSLKAKNEVVFLVEDVVKINNEKDLRIKGEFYNGTNFKIEHIKEVTVDLTLKCLDDTVYTLENYKFVEGDFEDGLKYLRLRHNETTGWYGHPLLVIKGAGEKVTKPFDNFIVTVKDIKFETAE